MDNKETNNITVEYYHTLEDKQITISLEEYKIFCNVIEKINQNIERI